ncbi:MAG: hypothetical protein Kow0088_25950 [Anaerolineales bacterium]
MEYFSHPRPFSLKEKGVFLPSPAGRGVGGEGICGSSRASARTETQRNGVYPSSPALLPKEEGSLTPLARWERGWG